MRFECMICGEIYEIEFSTKDPIQYCPKCGHWNKRGVKEKEEGR